MMRFASLGSGSRGNALVVESGSTCVLLDCGFGPRNLKQRLLRAGLSPDDIHAIFITHEHSDHIGGAFASARQYGYPIYLTQGTFVAATQSKPVSDDVDIRLIDSHSPLAFNDLQVQPFPVPHDAREPVQYVFSNGDLKLGVLTDIGFSTPHVESMLSGCHGLVLECNHDADMLANGDYPFHLKQRIGGRFGHLANDVAAALLANLDRSCLQHLIAAHLSEQNNTPELARAALSAVMGCETDWIDIADQEEGFAWKALHAVA